MPEKIANWSCLVLVSCFFIGCDGGSSDPLKLEHDELKLAGTETRIAPDITNDVFQSTVPEGAKIEIQTPSLNSPLAIGAAMDRAFAKPSESLKLVIGGRILSDWYIYAADGPSGVGHRTRFELVLPDGVVQEGEWELPEAKLDVSTFGPVAKYVDQFESSVTLKVGEQVPAGDLEVRCLVHYQACDLNQCLQPKTIQTVVPITIFKKLE